MKLKKIYEDINKSRTSHLNFNTLSAYLKNKLNNLYEVSVSTYNTQFNSSDKNLSVKIQNESIQVVISLIYVDLSMYPNKKDRFLIDGDVYKNGRKRNSFKPFLHSNLMKPLSEWDMNDAKEWLDSCVESAKTYLNVF